MILQSFILSFSFLPGVPQEQPASSTEQHLKCISKGVEKGKNK